MSEPQSAEAVRAGDRACGLAVEVVNGNPAERILVIAPNYRAFTWWCHKNGINGNAANIRVVLADHDLRGYSSAWYACLGFPPGPEGQQLWLLLEHMKATRGFKNVETA